MSAHEIPQSPAAPAHGDVSAEATFSLFGVFRISSSHPVVLDGRDVPAIVQELEDVAASLAEEGVSVRGWYDVSGIRSDADVLVWLHGAEVEDLQWAMRQLRRCALLRPLIRSWSTLGVEQPGQPLLAEQQPGSWLTCAAAPAPHTSMTSPEVTDLVLRSYATAGQVGARWLLAAEGDDPATLMELVHAAQGSPVNPALHSTVFTGRFIEPAEIVEVLQ